MKLISPQPLTLILIIPHQRLQLFWRHPWPPLPDFSRRWYDGEDLVWRESISWVWPPLDERVAQGVEEGGLAVSCVDFIICETGGLADCVPTKKI